MPGLAMILLLVFLAGMAYLVWYIRISSKKLPPGPRPLPLLGNLLHIGYQVTKRGDLKQALKHYKKVYGPVFTLWLGPIPTVHLGTLEAAHEALIGQGNIMMDRFTPDIMDIGRDSMGIIWSKGEFWREQRRFTMQTLKDFGLGRNVMEKRIMKETDARFAELEGVINPMELFDLLVGSIVNRMMFSTQGDENKLKEFSRLKTRIDHMMENITIVDMCMKKWWLKIPVIGSYFSRMSSPFLELRSFVTNQVEERKAAIASGEHTLESEGGDYVDAYLLKLEQEKDNKNSTYSESALIVNVLDLWFAGQETTSITLTWGVLYLLHYPEVMEKVYKEISSITGGSRSLSLSDKHQTPYFNATITELQRAAFILNLNLWRQNSATCVVGGHTIEKGTAISPQLSLIMDDESVFENPEKFLPERFLSGGRLDRHVIPFGIGKRVCIGESMARAELYLVLGNLLDRFELQPYGELASLEALSPVALMRRPQRFRVVVTKRNNNTIQ